MLFSHLITTSSFLPLLCPQLYLAVGHILLVVAVLGGESSADFCDRRRLSCFEVLRGLGENDWNCSGNMGAILPIEIFLPPPFPKSTQLYGFDILPPVWKCPQLCCFSILNSF